jgi:isopentenyl-diphosphate delta-isomerase
MTDARSSETDALFQKGAGTGRGMGARDAGFDRVRFVHEALPDLDHDKIDLGADFLGKRLKAPVLIAVAPQRSAQAETVDAAIAEAAQHLGVALLVDRQATPDRILRRRAPDTVILTTIGAARLTQGLGLDDARREIDQIDADALMIELDPLRQACQPGGDRDWWGVGAALEALIRRLDMPVVVKSDGAGLSGRTAQRLIDMGAAAVAVSGSSGSGRAVVDMARAWDAGDQAHAAAFADWGASTVDALIDVRRACPEAVVIGSGDLRDGVDAAKAIRLGADLVGMNTDGVMRAGTSAESVIEHFQRVLRQLRTVCFCTNSANLAALRRAPIATFG